MNVDDDYYLLGKRIVNRIGRPFGINPFPRAFPNPLSLETTNADEIFNMVYSENYWGSAQSRSGVGSEVEFTARYREGLIKLVRERGFHRFFDAPCGDLNWMAQLIADTGIDYKGGDISSLVVQEAQQLYPSLDLRVFDVTADTFPDADAWHCRDCLFHLPFTSIKHAFENFADSSIPFALITSHRAKLLHRNLDVGFGGFRFLDLEWPPISLPSPIARISDFTPGYDFPRYVCLWSREQIANSLIGRGN